MSSSQQSQETKTMDEENPLEDTAATIPDRTRLLDSFHKGTKSMSQIPSISKQRDSFQQQHGRRGHHRRGTSISNMVLHMGQGVGSIAQDLRQDVSATFRTELQRIDSGRKFFLDMGMARSLSVLPESLSQLVEETTGIEMPTSSAVNEAPPTPTSTDSAPYDYVQDVTATSKVEEHPPTKAPFQMGPFLALLGAVLAVSSYGSAISLIKNVNPSLKHYWRLTATSLLLLYFAVSTNYKTTHHLWPKQLTSSQWITLLAAAFCYAGMGLLYINALRYTSIGNAVIGGNSQALFLILGKLILSGGRDIVCMELGGVLVAFTGCILCSVDEAKDSDNDKPVNLVILGDLMALGSGALGVGYLTFAKTLRPHLPVTVFMFLVIFIASLMVLVFLFVTDERGLSFSMDPHVGLFGWLSMEDNHLLIFIYIAVICNVIGTMGFVRAMQYFENLIISVATLLEPMVAVLIAFALGVGELPGPMGWVGNILVILGTFGVVYPSVNQSGGGH